MKAKRILPVVAGLAGAMLFAGCGNNGKNALGSLTLTDAEAALDYAAEDYVKLGAYKDLNVQYPTPEVLDEDVEGYIENVLYENTEYVAITDRAVQDGDCIYMDFKGTIDGEEFEGGTAEDFELTLGAGQFIDEFEQNLIGKNTGEEFTFTITFPEDYDEELGGKEAEFKVTIDEIYETNQPEYNDAFVAEISDCKTVAEYEEYVKAELLKSSEEDSIQVAGEDALAQAMENAEISGYPQDLYDEIYEENLQSYEIYAEWVGMSMEDFSDEEIEESTVSWVNEVLLVRAIANKEGIQVTDDSYEEDALKVAEDYEYDTVEEFEADYGKTYIVNEILRGKVLNFLYEAAKVEEVSATEYDSSDDEEYYEEDVTELTLE